MWARWAITSCALILLMLIMISTLYRHATSELWVVMGGIGVVAAAEGVVSSI